MNFLIANKDISKDNAFCGVVFCRDIKVNYLECGFLKADDVVVNELDVARRIVDKVNSLKIETEVICVWEIHATEMKCRQVLIEKGLSVKIVLEYEIENMQTDLFPAKTGNSEVSTAEHLYA